MEKIVVPSYVDWYTSPSSASAPSSPSSVKSLSVDRKPNIVKRKKAIRYRNRAAAPYQFR